MPTILEHLTEQNPVLNNDNSLRGTLIFNERWPVIDSCIDWRDFTFETLMSCYEGILNTQFPPFPDVSPPLTELESEIWDEDSLDHLLSRAVMPQVSKSLARAWRVCYPEDDNPIDVTRGGRARKLNENSNANRGSKRPYAGKSYLDWAGAKRVSSRDPRYINCCPGDTNLATKWHSSFNPNTGEYFLPIAQLLFKGGDQWNTRYGYVITQSELVVFRFSREAIGPGLASSVGSMSVADTDSGSVYDDPLPDVEYKPVEMKSIPWTNSGQGKLTVKLALWWLHMMAGAPGADISIKSDYPPLTSGVAAQSLYNLSINIAMTDNLLKYLTQPNPLIDEDNSLEGQVTRHSLWPTVTSVRDWSDFTYDTLMSCYGTVLEHGFDPFPRTRPQITNLECEVWDKNSLEHLLSRSIAPTVSVGLAQGWALCYGNHPNRVDITRGGRARTFNDKGKDRSTKSKQGSTSCEPTKEPRHVSLISNVKSSYPDWVGVVRKENRTPGYVNRCPGDTKLSINWESTDDRGDEFYRTISEILSYCDYQWDTRYGYIISQSELVVFRFSREEIGPESAAGGLPRASFSSVESESVFEKGQHDVEYLPVEMKSIPWDNEGEGKLTVKLALWWIHMLAAAPGCQTHLGNAYPPLNSWVELPDKSGYQHLSTGLHAKDPKKGQKYDWDTGRAWVGNRGMSPPRQGSPAGKGKAP